MNSIFEPVITGPACYFVTFLLLILKNWYALHKTFIFKLHSTKVGKMFWKLNYVRAEFYTVSTIETMFFNLRNVVVQQSLNITKKTISKHNLTNYYF